MTHEKYESLLERINQLMDSEPGTKEFEELEEIVPMVEMYEDKVYPI